MTGPFGNSSKGIRLVALNVILAAILAGAIGAAWTLARPTPADLRGRQILDEIRHTGLAAYWPEATTAWYVHSGGEGVTGWRAEAVIPGPNGTFNGLNVIAGNTSLGERGVWERWTLNADATEGSYSSGTLVQTARELRLSTDTTIALTNGQVTVSQWTEGYVVTTSAPAPKGYLPEGTMGIARRLVARHKAKARFRTVYNDLPPRGSRPAFTPLDMEFRRLDENAPKGARAAVRVVPGHPKRDLQDRYYLDAREGVIGRITRRSVEMQVAVPEVEAVFRNAARQFRQIAERRKMPRPTPARKPAASNPAE